MRRIHALPPRVTQQPSVICSRFYRVKRRDRWAPLRRLEISFSQGAKWKALISMYIGTIPLSGEASATQRKSGDLPSRSVSNAMMAKVGAATSDNQSAAPRAVVWPLPAQAPAASRSVAVITFVPGVDLDIGLLGPIGLAQRVYSSWRRHQAPVALRPLGARSSHWNMPQRPSSPRAKVE